MKHHESMRELYSLCEWLNVAPLRFGEMSEAASIISRAARSLHRISEQRCNGIERWDSQARMRLASWNDQDEARAEKREAAAERRATDALREVLRDGFESLRIDFQGDPRGAMIVIYEAGAPDGSGFRLAAW